MDIMKITYTPWIKNRARGGTKYYARVRERSCTYDIPLNTSDRATAEQWCILRRRELELYNSYVLAGEVPPREVSRKVCCRDNRCREERESLTVEQAVGLYLSNCRSRGLREATQEDYRRVLYILFRKEWRRPMGVDVDMVSRKVSGYSGKSQQTRRSYSYAMRGFLRFWMRHTDSFDQKVLDQIPNVKIDRVSHGVWTMEEMLRICNATNDPILSAYWHTLRVTGARNTEASLLKWSDYDGKYLTLQAEYTKGRKTRKLPVDGVLASALARVPRTHENVFYGLPTTNTGRNNMLRECIARAGVPDGTMHKFRHSAATHYFRKGVDIKTVSQLLGHASESTTIAIYLEATGAEQMAEKILKVL